DLLDQCLRPKPEDRPANAMEVYLRLQELGKASGILLLPPGAMDKLVAARQANAATQVYTPPEPTPEEKRRRLQRRILLATLAVVGVLAMAAVVKMLFFSGGGKGDGGPESVHDIKIGDTMDQVEDHAELDSPAEGNPWNLRKVRPRLGAVLEAGDLKLTAD